MGLKFYNAALTLFDRIFHEKYISPNTGVDLVSVALEGFPSLLSQLKIGM